MDPVLDHFGAVTVAIPGIFGFRSEIATCFSTEPVSEPVPMAVYGVLLDLHVSKSSANQHPAGPVRSPVLVFASSKKHAGRNNPRNSKIWGNAMRKSFLENVYLRLL